MREKRCTNDVGGDGSYEKILTIIIVLILIIVMLLLPYVIMKTTVYRPNKNTVIFGV